MTATPLLQTEALVKTFGALVATRDLDLTVQAGEIHALIGPNGAGKSTLVAQLAGELRSNSGRILFDGMDITHLDTPRRVAAGLVRSFQITSIFADFTALTNVAMAVQARAGHSFRFWQDARFDRRLTEPARALLDRVGLGHRADARAGDMAYGEQRQLEIAMALATEPRLLLLDEPLAGMGREDAQVIVGLLRSLRSRHTILLIEHDMDAVFSLADRITVLVYGQAIATDRPEAIRTNAEVQEAYLGESAQNLEAQHA